jgi:hypothetical protein
MRRPIAHWDGAINNSDTMSPTERQTIIRGIREKIEQMERAVQELPILKQTLAIFEADAVADQRTMQLPLRPVSLNGANGAHPANAVEIPALKRIYRINVVKGSVGYHALQIIEAASRPITVKEIMAELQARGKTNGEATLVSVLCWYTKEGMIKRTAPSTYAEPDTTIVSVPMPEESA